MPKLVIKDSAFSPLMPLVYGFSGRYLMEKGGAGSGKCFARGTEIVMSDGSLKKVDDLNIGDKIMGWDSTPRLVTDVYAEYGDLYRIKQSRGIDYVVNANHTLVLKKSVDAKHNQRYNNFNDIVEISVSQYLETTKRFKRNFFGFRGKAKFNSKKVKIDPYFLGLWLGDGHSNATAITSADKEIIDFLYYYADTIKHQVSIDCKPDNKAASYWITEGSRGSKPSWLKQSLREYNLLGNKHIPDDYKYNSEEVRLKVLAGIIDTDGCLSGGNFDITLKSKRLAEDVAYISRSLGLKCSLNQCQKSIKKLGFVGTYYRLNIGGEINSIPTLINRKQWRKPSFYDDKISSIKIIPEGKGEYVGFTIEGDGKFFLSDFTIVHNSERAAAKFLIRMLTEKPHRFVCFRKVGKTIRNSQFKLLKDQIQRWNLSKAFDVKETDMVIICKANKNEMLSIGMDDREKIKSLTSITGAWVEEPTELDESDFNQIDTRLRGYTQNYKQIYGTFNPISEHNWIKGRFFDEYVEQTIKDKGFAYTTKEIPMDGAIVRLESLMVHSTYKDNPFLPAEDRATLESYKEIDIQHYKIYALGEWGSIGNLIYPDGFRILESYPTAFEEELYGLDFGFNNPTALIKASIRDQEFYLDELFYEKGFTNTDLGQELLKMKREDGTWELKDGSVVYCDCAEPARIKELNDLFSNNGRSVDFLPADKSVKDGIDYLKSQKIYSKPSNVNINKEVKGYKWKETSDGKVIDGEPVKINDHAMDAIRYPLYTHSLSPDLKMAFI